MFSETFSCFHVICTWSNVSANATNTKTTLLNITKTPTVKHQHVARDYLRKVLLFVCSPRWMGRSARGDGRSRAARLVTRRVYGGTDHSRRVRYCGVCTVHSRCTSFVAFALSAPKALPCVNCVIVAVHFRPYSNGRARLCVARAHAKHRRGFRFRPWCKTQDLRNNCMLDWLSE